MESPVMYQSTSHLCQGHWGGSRCGTLISSQPPPPREKERCLQQSSLVLGSANHVGRRELLSTQERWAPTLSPPGFSLLGSLYPSHVQSARPEWLKVSSLEVPHPGGDAPATHLSEAGPRFSSASVPQHPTALPGHPRRKGCVCVSDCPDSPVLVVAGQEIRLLYNALFCSSF